MLASEDGGAVVRLIAGSLDAQTGPGSTRTPIIYAHATVVPGAILQVPWRKEFNALCYVLSGRGSAGGGERARIKEGQLAVMGEGDVVTIIGESRPEDQSPTLEILLLGGRPIREPVSRHGPFVMNNREEVIQAITDYHAGRMGSIPAKRQDA